VADPVLHLLAGPNGAGKSQLHRSVLADRVHLEFVNADHIAAARWPGEEVAHGHDAARAAAQRRAELLVARRSFIAETVFSHPSKLDLIRNAHARGFHAALYVVCVPEELSVARVANRVANGGHDVPDDKVRQRWWRLWPLLAEAVAVADTAKVYDNSSARQPYRLVARYRNGALTEEGRWPVWLPDVTRDAGRRPDPPRR
jgi:predicted ABC-type ATPase